jgi:hypothetical protein
VAVQCPHEYASAKPVSNADRRRRSRRLLLMVVSRFFRAAAGSKVVARPSSGLRRGCCGPLSAIPAGGSPDRGCKSASAASAASAAGYSCRSAALSARTLGCGPDAARARRAVSVSEGAAAVGR